MNDTLCQNIHAARRKTRKIQGNSRHCKMLGGNGFMWLSLAGKYEICQ